MTKRKENDRNHTDPAQTMQDLVGTKQEHARQTPGWPGAREQAQPQHAQPGTAPETPPPDIENAPPSKSGYERNEIGKRHH